MSDEQNSDPQSPSQQELKEALDKSSSINRTLGLGFSVFIFIMALMVAATTDMDLFIPDSTFTFPLINLPLNIKYFYIAAPFVVLIMHYNLLYNLHQHSEKLLRLYTNKTNGNTNANKATSETKQDSLMMYPFLFNFALTVQNPLHSLALNLVIRTTVFILPLALLFFILIRFADYQSMAISAWHFAAVLLDMALIATHSRSIIQVIKTRNDEVSDDYGWLDFFAYRKGKPRIKNFTLNATRFLFRIVPRAISTTFKYLRLELAIAVFAVAYFVFFVYIMTVNIDINSAHDSPISKIIPRLSLPEEVLVKSQPDQQIKALYLNTSLTPEERNHKEQEIILKFTEPYILKGRSFRYANLRETILTKSDLRDADLSGAFLVNSKMQVVQLKNANLFRTVLSRVNLQGTNLQVANLQKAILYKANLQGADISKADLLGVNLSEANLQGANLYSANLQGANLVEANLQGVDLTYAELQGANLKEANLQGADFKNCKIQGANLRKANLQGANLFDANLYGIIFDATTIKGALLDYFFRDTILFISLPYGSNDHFYTYPEIDSIALLILDENLKSNFKTRMLGARDRFEDDTLTLAEKVPSAKIFYSEYLTIDSSFYLIRRRIAAQNSFVASSMLLYTRQESFLFRGRHPFYKSLYKDLYSFLKSNHPDYIENFPFNEDGY